MLIYFSIYTCYKHLFSRLAFMFSKLGIYGKIKWPLFNFLNWSMCGSFCINSFSSFSFSSSLSSRGAGKLQGRDSCSSCSACTETAPDHFGSYGTQYLLFSKTEHSGSSRQWGKAPYPMTKTKKNPGALPEWRSTVWGDERPRRSKTCTTSSKAYDPFCDSPSKKTKISCIQMTFQQESSHLSGSTLQPRMCGIAILLFQNTKALICTSFAFSSS